MPNPGSPVFSSRPRFSSGEDLHSSRSFKSCSISTRIAFALVTSAIVLLTPSTHAQSSSYVETSIISDGSVPAQKTDPTLINPWGVSIGTAFWINTAGTGFSLVEDASGNKSFAVTIPPAVSTEPHGLPAGTVFNSNTSIFNIPNSGSANFLFGNLDGSIAAWNTNTPQAVTVVNNSAAKASYTDIAVATNATGTFLLAANFGAGTVDVFDSNFNSAHLAGSFTDPNIPTGYAPFGIHAIGNNVYVTYAQVNSDGRENVGAGLGYVDAFDLNGNFVQRAISQGALNAPWGMALAPSGFGSLGGDLLVGNFGDGVINAFDPVSFALKGQISDSTGKPIAFPGLWEIVFGVGNTIGTSATSGDPNTLYFAAGINNEKDGLFGSIAVAPPAGTADFTLTAASNSVTVTKGQVSNLALSIAGTNGFSGNVTLACSGLPAGTTCVFSPPSVTASGTTPTAVTLAFADNVTTPPTGYMAALRHHSQATLTGLLPLTLLSLAAIRRRLTSVRGSLLLLTLCLLTIGTVTGCSSGTRSAAMAPAPTTPTTPPPVTPVPTPSQITITATSGSLSHSVMVSLTMN